MIRTILLAAVVAVPATAPAAAHFPEQIEGHDPGICDDKPVVMVIAGVTNDRDRMMAYGKAIADSGLYDRLGGYYLNVPRPLAAFEGDPEPGYTVLMVRFPCLANAKAFWHSKTYQQAIKPLRLTPSAGDYRVTVYPEAGVPPYMAGRVGDGAYAHHAD